MSSLQKLLPACEPARSEALALLAKAHHLPRHLVKGIARRGLAAVGVPQHQQQTQQQEPAQGPQSPEAPLQPS
ncbi:MULTISPECIES: hypothetical protein [unclassified Variovorax]|uniref:hypothetical protein n=1 Tax=unclassified Variovorax TaxID=663243 RepID=UPI00076C4D21|nr:MULTISPECIES: hypothetical protein [unclassified Variovorax]KWT78643.1 hypothetical protein APY03_5223 [Variovorax sp. WDL1]PNG52937.1 hypothetical protein CHC06_04277 [Variovorax sp. B2]PNG53509.1 hypothetical protein CHC07_03324 [Variovorax sp. B4]VTV10929.1 hypothetical protein WDL1CHR_01838 [Variovorax sp. WDL1]